ncbi:unnamed protein product [Owenia fusiformis]|uniref:Uncharacterized protein n=1 Tax=Owenia fusiformis TaxID=6347 RepID=A0A8J1TF96_OWEFU|nr:unnamed protein product [Owenia fusiformis]
MAVRLYIVLIVHTVLAANNDTARTAKGTEESISEASISLENGTSFGVTETPNIVTDREEHSTISATAEVNSSLNNNGTNWTMVGNTTDVMTLNVSTRRPSYLWSYCNKTGYTPYQFDPYWIWELLMVTKLYLKLPLAIVGVCGNIISFIVLRKENQNTSTFLLQTLAIVDLFLCINYMIHEVVMVLYSNSFALLPYRTHPVYQNWRRIEPILELYLLRFFEILSAWLIALISIDRYIAVCKPFAAPTLSTIKRMRLALCLIALVVAVLCLPRVLSLKVISMWFPCRDEDYYYMKGNEMWYNVDFQLWFVTVTYGGLTLVLPMVIVVVVQGLLIHHLRLASKNRATLTGDTKGASKATTNLTLTLVVIAIVFFLCITPEFMVFILNVLQFTDLEPEGYNVYGKIIWTAVANLFRFFNSVINFFIYCLVRQGFRKQLVGMLCPKWSAKQKSTIGQTSRDTKSTDIKMTDESQKY